MVEGLGANAPGELWPTEENARNNPQSLRCGPSAPVGCWGHAVILAPSGQRSIVNRDEGRRCFLHGTHLFDCVQGLLLAINFQSVEGRFALRSQFPDRIS